MQIEEALHKRKLRDTPLLPEEASFLASCSGEIAANWPGSMAMPGMPASHLPGSQDFGPVLELAQACSLAASAPIRHFSAFLYCTLYRYSLHQIACLMCLFDLMCNEYLLQDVGCSMTTCPKVLWPCRLFQDAHSRQQVLRTLVQRSLAGQQVHLDGITARVATGSPSSSRKKVVPTRSG